MSDRSSLYSSIYALVSQVPEGFVTTYGDIAKKIGCSARTVGFAMAALPAGHHVPWQRVINSRGQISPRNTGDGHDIQRMLLKAEGICFDSRQRIDLQTYGWRFESP